jgi:hypothetical protein
VSRSTGCAIDDNQFAYVGVFLRSAGAIEVFQWDGAQKHASASYTIGNLVVATAQYDGTNISIAVNNGTPVTAAAGNIQVTTGQMRIARANTAYFSGDLYSMLFYKSALNSTQLTQNYNYLAARYP